MSSFGKRADSPTDRRVSERQTVFVTGSAVTVRGSKSVLIENLSLTGAKLLGRDLPETGKQILVWTEGFDALGSVAWKAFGQGGVVFDAPLEGSAWLP